MASDKKEKQQGKPAQLWSRIKAWFRGILQCTGQRNLIGP